MKEQETLPSIDKLDKDIRLLREKVVPAPRPAKRNMGFAMQLGLELVSGVLVGTLIGVALDRWLGTSPLFLLACFSLGTAGGGLTLYRTAMASGDTTRGGTGDKGKGDTTNATGEANNAEG